MCIITFRPDLDFIQRFLVDMIEHGFFVILCIIITVITYFRAVVNVKRFAEMHFQRINSGIHKLLWYPAVLFLVFLPSLVDHFVLVIDPTHVPSLIFLIPHVAITHSIGFINAIIYGLQKRTLKYKRSETIESLDEDSKQVDMANLSFINDSSHQGNIVSRNDSYVL